MYIVRIAVIIQESWIGRVSDNYNKSKNAVRERAGQINGDPEYEVTIIVGDRGTLLGGIQRESISLQGILCPKQSPQSQCTTLIIKLLTHQQRIIALFLLIENFKS